MTTPLPPPRQSAGHHSCKQWFEFLLHANTHPKNIEPLHAFFLHEFIRSPHQFVHCLSHIRQELRHPSSDDRREHMARHFLSILSPICEQFGLFAQKNEMETLCFNILEPDHFRSVVALLKSHRKQSRIVIAEVTTALRKILADAHHRCSIQGRFKSAVSIYRKLKQKGRGHPLEIQDIFAFRIILREDSISACFDTLHILHDHYQPLPGRFKDYITIPKLNGYQSLHTVLTKVLPTLSIPIEVQIRTRKMHEFAERGLASHWLYKNAPRHHSAHEKEHKLLQHYRLLAHEAEQGQMVYCLSPTGDVVALPHGATAIDFAYHIHSKLGDAAKEVSVNGTLQPLQYQIRNGDRIEIIRSIEREVKHDWLQFALTPTARRRIYERTRP